MKLLQLIIIVLWSVVGFCQDPKPTPTPDNSKGRQLQAASDFDCRTSSKTCTINIASQNPSKDEKTTGPKEVLITGANTLRRDYVFSSTITFSASPIDLSALGLVTKTPTPDAKAQDDTQKQKAAAGTAADKLDAMASKMKAAGLVPTDEIDAFDIAPMKSAIQQVFTDNEKDLEALENNVNQLIQAANQSGQTVNQAARDMHALLLNSDSILRIGGTRALMHQINERKLVGACPTGPSSVFQMGLCAKWPAIQDVENLVNQAKALQNRARQKQDVATQNLGNDEARLRSLDFTVASQPTQPATQKGKAVTDNQHQSLSNKANVMNFWITRHAVYSSVKSQTGDQLARVDNVLKKLADLASGKSSTDFLTAQQDLRNWNERMITVTQVDAPFALPSHTVPCNFAFAGTKTIKIDLIEIDRLPPALTVMEPGSSSSSAKAATATPKTIPLITVECSSPFAMSAGVAFSSITERDFVVQKGADGQNRFATDAHSNFHPLPLAMVNMRYMEFNRFLALYGSFGVAANIKGQSAGGSDPEYLFTPLTFGFFRTAFISPALHIGRDVRLGSNFHEGDVVPASITTPPLQKSYKMGFGIAVTFTKP